MKKIKLALITGIFLLNSNLARADEGMWLLSLLQGYTIEDMQKEGFKLTAEDIYSVNEACLKDAVVIFGGGCTGEMISDKGLVLTNHHCGYGAIQSHSSVENDYLTDGFWAMSKEEELPNPRMSVTFLRYMDDVSDKVYNGVEHGMSEDEIDDLIEENISALSDAASEEGRYSVRITPLYYGNEYYMFVYERFMDVRLVGAPPSSIGNFGEDNDNWMWPRHTGDFSLFRVYADAENNPAEYSPDNKPYIPRKSFEISVAGVQEGDFTMLLGYPGSTQQFLYSDALETYADRSLPLRIELRTKRLEIMDKYMKQSDVVRIQYASKFRGVSNAWKKWQGLIRGLKRLDAIHVKRDFEEDFRNWVSESNERQEEYGELLTQFEDIYRELAELGAMIDLQREALGAIELYRVSSAVKRAMENDVEAENIRSFVRGFYKDYHHPIDEEMFALALRYYHEYAPESMHPEFFKKIEKRYKGDFAASAAVVYKKSIFKSLESCMELIDLYEQKPKLAHKALGKVPILEYTGEFSGIYATISPQYSLLQSSLQKLYKTYVKGMMEMQPDERFYPDANFTMRVTYGKVQGYEPMDATRLYYQTYLGGVIEKSKTGKHDYVIPERLEELYEAKDYGTYGVEGKMPVCFTASNHTSGGNSGSPVLDAEGRLIGINFDRNWEGTMSDEMYDPTQCRNISVDIRYVLFVIDKYAGAGYLLDEMVINSGDTPEEEVVPETVEEEELILQ